MHVNGEWQEVLTRVRTTAIKPSELQHFVEEMPHPTQQSLWQRQAATCAIFFLKDFETHSADIVLTAVSGNVAKDNSLP